MQLYVADPMVAVQLLARLGGHKGAGAPTQSPGAVALRQDAGRQTAVRTVLAEVATRKRVAPVAVVAGGTFAKGETRIRDLALSVGLSAIRLARLLQLALSSAEPTGTQAHYPVLVVLADSVVPAITVTSVDLAPLSGVSHRAFAPQTTFSSHAFPVVLTVPLTQVPFAMVASEPYRARALEIPAESPVLTSERTSSLAVNAVLAAEPREPPRALAHRLVGQLTTLPAIEAVAIARFFLFSASVARPPGIAPASR